MNKEQKAVLKKSRGKRARGKYFDVLVHKQLKIPLIFACPSPKLFDVKEHGV